LFLFHHVNEPPLAQLKERFGNRKLMMEQAANAGHKRQAALRGKGSTIPHADYLGKLPKNRGIKPVRLHGVVRLSIMNCQESVI